MAQTPKNIAIIGSGLVGSLLAIYLRRIGHTVTVFDRRPDIRTIKFSGRSINLAMSNRGWRSLDEVGIGDRIKDIAIPLDKRAMHVNDKPVYFQKYGKEGEAIWSISRGILNKRMIDLAEEAGAQFRFNEKVWDVDLPEAKIFTGESEKSEWKEYNFDLIFGCDGAFSRVRHKMQRRSRYNYSQEFIDVGYKELTIPANEDGTHKLDKNSFHIWPRGEFMLIAMPNIDGSFTCTLFLPFEGKVSFESLQTEEQAREFFKTYFPNVRKVIEDLTKDFFNNPTSAMVTMKCYPWTYWDKVALVGDSAHAMVPFYGQGMNAGFEDCALLIETLEQFNGDWESTMRNFSSDHSPNGHAIADLALRNFIEMRDSVADRRFLLRKKIEAALHERLGEKWIPLYTMVTFSHIPYLQALNEGRRQDQIMERVLQLPEIELWQEKPEVFDKVMGLVLG